MITEDGPPVYGYTIFCDDIRLEVGNKITLVGTYTGVLYVPGFPFMMPKLAMQIVYLQRRPNVVPPTKIFIFLPEATDEEPSLVIDVPPEAAQQIVTSAEQRQDSFPSEAVYASMGLQFSILNLVLTQPGLIKVRAVREDKLIRLGSLSVLIAPTEPTNPATS